MAQEVLKFWFQEIDTKQWWAVDPAFDAQLKDRFLPLLNQAARCELFRWRSTPHGRLAEIIVLDQFARNIHRNSPEAFAQDALALALSQEAVSSGTLEPLGPIECAFLLMPYMHSESALIHLEAERLYKAWTPTDNYEFELRHKVIIDRFGRYPHRNRILGRASTLEEEEFLKQSGSSF